MKIYTLPVLLLFAFLSGTVAANPDKEVTAYAQTVLNALNTEAALKKPLTASSASATPSSGVVKITVTPNEKRIVTVEPTSKTTDGLWHFGISEIAWAIKLPDAPKQLAQRFDSIQFSVFVTLDDNYKYTFSQIVPLNGLVFVSFE